MRPNCIGTTIVRDIGWLRLLSYPPQVKVEKGVAILRGTVDTWLMWQTAIDLALEAGSRRPHNLIAVRYGDPSAPRFYGPHYYVPE